MIDRPHHATAFGLRWRSDIPLYGFAAADDRNTASIDVHRIDAPADRGAGRPIPGGTLYADGIRFAWRDEVVFDIRDGTTIAYHPGRDWTGSLPVCFYSTIAALAVAWRGLVPLHACAIAVDGKAVLIAGQTGAGKSTLTAGLVGLGARFVADDLTVVSIDRQRVAVPRGRPTIRLYPDIVARLDTTDAEPVIDDPRGKWIARPRHRQGDDGLDLGAVILLGDAPPAGTPNAVVLLEHIFRPRLLAALPMRTALIRDVIGIAARVPVLVHPAQGDCRGSALQRRAKDVMIRIRTRSS